MRGFIKEKMLSRVHIELKIDDLIFLDVTLLQAFNFSSSEIVNGITINKDEGCSRVSFRLYWT